MTQRPLPGAPSALDPSTVGVARRDLLAWDDDEIDEEFSGSRRDLERWVADEVRLREALDQLPKRLNTAKRPLPMGRRPKRVRRAAALARFNPDDTRSVPGGDFSTSEVLDFFWGDPGQAVSEDWLSSEPRGTPRGLPGTSGWAKIANRYDRLVKEDVLFIQRSGGGPARNHPALPGQSIANPCIVGVWSVESKITWTQAGIERPVDRVFCRPLVLFDTPVRLDYAREADPAFDGLLAHPDVPRSTQTLWSSPDGFLELTPDAALTIAKNCSVPYDLFTSDDLIGRSADLQRAWTGETPKQRARRVREGQTLLSRLAEANAVISVWHWLRVNSWTVGDFSHRGNTGWDLQAVAKLARGRYVRRLIEVKGTHEPNDHSVTLRRSQHDAALKSAKAGDGRWLLAVVTSTNTQTVG